MSRGSPVDVQVKALDLSLILCSLCFSFIPLTHSLFLALTFTWHCEKARRDLTQERQAEGERKREATWLRADEQRYLTIKHVPVAWEMKKNKVWIWNIASTMHTATDVVKRREREKSKKKKGADDTNCAKWQVKFESQKKRERKEKCKLKEAKAKCIFFHSCIAEHEKSKANEKTDEMKQAAQIKCKFCRQKKPLAPERLRVKEDTKR